MLIDELFEAGGFWKGVGQSLAQRYAPAADFGPRSSASTQQGTQGLGKAVGRAMKRMIATQTQPAAQSQQSAIPPAKDYSQYQIPTVMRKGAPALPTVQPPAQPQPTVTKPRVPTQPIRVGNKIYRPGDPMHTRLSQMMQAQQRT